MNEMHGSIFLMGCFQEVSLVRVPKVFADNLFGMSPEAVALISDFTDQVDV